ncbi:M15 family metallopeptidase [Noviherbaspirillum sp.]|uniref:M15 family metallopeptidase n=1 Tax=Noviherbaspirillum sp. TaxID=1926288 RepID=UPI002FDF1606
MGSLVAMLCVMLMLLLAWVGWRFFSAPANRINNHVRTPDAKKNTLTAAQAVQRRNGAIRRKTVRPWTLVHAALWAAPVLAGITIASVLAISGRISLDPLEMLDFARQQHVRGALRPEKLVPPPALPPSVFIVSGRPGLQTADRDWNRLHPAFMQFALLVFARMEARGYPMALLEGYRSAERQDMLADSPQHVTNARGYESKHQYGLALDAAPIRDGRLVISERDPWAMQAYQALGEEAEKVGLVWGGRWKLRDFGHIEMAGTIAAGLQTK